ncbi:MAG: hypothetical protein KAS12_07285 [Candidatus Aenigmarchaeota archaeon]|nr:hypothetical protein [Candidatus Aenigmarchaeota archaeon]
MRVERYGGVKKTEHKLNIFSYFKQEEGPPERNIHKLTYRERKQQGI